MSSIVIDRPPSTFNANSNSNGNQQPNASGNEASVVASSPDKPPAKLASDKAEPTESSGPTSHNIFSGQIFGTSATLSKTLDSDDEPKPKTDDKPVQLEQNTCSNTCEEEDTADVQMKDTKSTDEHAQIVQEKVEDKDSEKCDEIIEETKPKSESSSPIGGDTAKDSEMVIAKVEEVGGTDSETNEPQQSMKDEEEQVRDEEGDNVVIQEEIVTSAPHEQMPVLEPVLGELGEEVEVGTARGSNRPNDPPEKYGVDETGIPTKRTRKSTNAVPVNETEGGRRVLRNRTPKVATVINPRIGTPMSKRRRLDMENPVEKAPVDEVVEKSTPKPRIQKVQVKTTRTPATENEKEEEEEEVEEKEESDSLPETPSVNEKRTGLRHSSRGSTSSSAKSTPAPATKATPKVAKATPKKTPRTAKKVVAPVNDDPYDMDNLDAVPGEIQVEKSAFGAVKFTKPVSAGGSRFKHTSRVAQRNSTMDESFSAEDLPETKSMTPTKSKKSRASGVQLFGDMEDAEETETPTKRGAKVTATTTPARKPRQSSQYSDSISRPKTQKVEIPELSQEEQVEADNPVGLTYVPGSRVLAKWKDKNFYPGQVVSKDGLGRYKVHFLEDAVDRDMPPPDVVGLPALTVGKVLSIVNEDEEMQAVEIKDTPSTNDAQEWNHCIFTVYNTVTEVEEKVHWLRFIMDPEQSASFVSNMVNEAAQSISMANVGRDRTRVRRSVAIATPLVESSPEPSSAPKIVAKRKTPGKTPAKAKKVKPIVEEEEAAAAAIPSEVEETVKPTKNMVFTGFKFVLTSANRRAVKTDDNEENTQNEPVVQFNKRSVRAMVEERGGEVLEDFGSCVSTKNLYLVADTHYRTHKYLSALARAIPCVSHLWIHQSHLSNSLKDHRNYMLPSGVSLEKNTLVDWHDKCPTLLSDLTVLVYTHNKPSNPNAMDFVQIWKPLVVCMNANAIDEMPDADTHVDIVLTDASCPSEMLDEAGKRGAYAVSSEWLIQAIITGKRPEHTEHPKYKSDYIETAQ